MSPPSVEPGDSKGASPTRGDETKQLSEAELLSWARKRGVVTFFIFFSIAATVAVIWYLTR